jgi:hypothetical protein
MTKPTKRNRKRKAKRFTFKLDEKLLAEMRLERMTEPRSERQEELIETFITDVMRGPALKARKAGLANRDLGLALTIMAGGFLVHKSRGEYDSNVDAMLRAFLMVEFDKP